jgi:hypothetical protein
MASGTSVLNAITLFVSHGLGLRSGTKRSADEADVATREDGPKRKESPGAGKDTKRGPKVRVPFSLL